MIRKALARHGVSAVDNEEKNKIFADKSEIRLNGVIYPNIDSLLDAVDSVFDRK